MPSFPASIALDRLRDAMKRENASEAVVVTRKMVPPNLFHLKDDQIKFMTLREFRRYLAEQS